jgi:hypothetical protein
MDRLFRSTPGGKVGAIDGLNLFFGVLLGANLGTIQGMSQLYYMELIFILAATVMTLRMMSTSPRRIFMLVNVLLYVLVVGAFLLWPPLQPKGVAEADLHRLAATLGIWVMFALAAEFSPVRDTDRADPR